MKFLVVFACALVAVSAGYVAPVVSVAGAYPGPLHFPVIDHQGVPVDTAEVQYAKNEHFAHKVNAAARNGDVVAPVVAAYQHAYPVGVPADTAEVAAAKANHFAAHAEALARNAHSVIYRARRGIYAYAAAPFYNHAYPTTAVAPVSVNGVPQETPEVFAAKLNHFAAHSEALARTGYPTALLYRHRRGVYTPAPLAYSTAYNTPVVTAAHYGYTAPVVAATYAHTAPLAHSTYAHYY